MPFERPWPAGAVEVLGRCPVCQSAERSLLHEALEDRIFCVAAGRWTMWECAGCGVGYLDPRPDRASIGMAYGSYYTHEKPLPPAVRRSLVATAREALANDYRNARFACAFRPALFPGRWLVPLAKSARERWDIEHRFLERGPGAHPLLLDIGCGNGAFLQLARRLGFEACGVEPDEAAREVCIQAGIDVRGTLEEWQDARRQFDHVTLSHVIEHVHDVPATLATITSLTKTGGTIYVETPNLRAPTHRLWGAAWRGLEPPRHLVLLNREELQKQLEGAGYRAIRFHDRSDARAFLDRQSENIAAGREPYAGNQVAPPMKVTPLETGWYSGEKEFLLVTAVKSS